MTWAVVARKDFRDAGRSKVLWALSILFVLLTAGMAYLYTVLLNTADLPLQGGLTVAGLTAFLGPVVILLMPIIGLVVGYKAVAGEVESGRAKILLSLPHTRRDVVLGKVVGRTGVLLSAVLLGFAVAAVVVLVLYESFAAVDYLLFTALTVAFGAVFVSIGVGISAATRSTGVAATGVVGVFVLFQFLWQAIRLGVHFLVTGSLFPAGEPPDWFFLLQQIRPGNAYQTLVQSWFAPSPAGATPALPSPFLSDWFAVLVLAVWLLVPPVLGYLRFEAADL